MQFLAWKKLPYYAPVGIVPYHRLSLDLYARRNNMSIYFAGYGVHYEFIDPRELMSSLQTK